MGKSKAVLLIYGEGGHKKEMELFLSSLPDDHSLEFISMGPSHLSKETIAHYVSQDARDKHNRFQSLVKAIASIINSTAISIKLLRKYKLQGVVSTGPGIALVPFLILNIFGVKTIFIETFCRFHSRSVTGRIMYKIASRFLVQNKELLSLYPKAEYCGRL